MNKYDLVKKFILDKIENKELKAGGKLPSIRSLSDNFTCSKATIIRAYEELEKEHLIYSVPQSGYYVVEHLSNKLDQQEKLIDFASAAPDSSILPYKDFQHCINIAIDRYKENLFSYGDAQGLKSLIETLCKQFRNYQIFTKEENIFLTAGSQQALSILSSMNFPNGKNNVLIEQPTYHGIIEALRIQNVRTLGIERSFNGMDFNELERIFRNGNIKFFYTIPRFSNPMGLSYTKQEKISILKLAKKYDVYIIEDDYLADLATEAKEDSMFSMDEDNRVIYIKSFSKILLPGLRIGAVILPKLLIKTFEEHKKWADLSTPVLSQGALEIYINSGMFEIHKRKMAELYSIRMDILGKTLEATAGQGIVFNKPSSGIFSGFLVNKKVDNSKLIKELLEKNIVLQDCSKLFLKEFYDESVFRISVSRADEAMIKEGIPKIIECISQHKVSTYSFQQVNLEL